MWGRYIDEATQLTTYTTTGGGSLAAGTYYPLQDLLYRTTALTDSSGNIVEAYDTDAYGNTLIFSAADGSGNWWADDATQSDLPACEYLFTGRQYDPETGIYFYRARYYVPSLARFLQRDPAGYIGVLNLYEYAAGLSTKKVDPFGLQGSSAGAIEVGGGAAAAEALIAAISAAWWLPYLLAALLVAFAAWELVCRSLYRKYADVCKHLPGCLGGLNCAAYTPIVAAYSACYNGRKAYLDAGCDVIIPTGKDHPGALAQSLIALNNCQARQTKACAQPTISCGSNSTGVYV